MPYADRQKQLSYKRKWNKNYYRCNRAQERRRIAERKQQISQWLREYKSSLYCAICGETESICLDFHHSDSNAKDMNLAQVASWGWGRDRIANEIKRCIVLCANCHRKRHAGLI